MSDPVIVAPAIGLPVTVAEAKLHLRVDGDDDDALIESMIAAATGHLDGYDGVLGRAIMSQTWREDFDGFPTGFRLRMGPVSGLVSVVYTDDAGDPQTVTGARLLTSGGVTFVYPALGASWPSGSGVAIEYTAGYAVVPAPLKAAILLHVGALYENREAVSDKSMAAVPLAYESLVSPYRREIV